ncbi:MAG: hypothetical protein KME26_18780 [Oscillatoria princeps RMCB-10]|nr:hypothetical protein [Oscillatoria princeps RMCB-10]
MLRRCLKFKLHLSFFTQRHQPRAPAGESWDLTADNGVLTDSRPFPFGWADRHLMPSPFPGTVERWLAATCASARAGQPNCLNARLT